MDLLASGPQTSGVPPSDHNIEWYRTPLPSALSSKLHTLSDAQGAVQTLGFLSILASCAASAVYFASTPYHSATVLSVLLYGLVSNFLINGMHELGHGTVFKTPALNAIFLRIVSFLGWLHPDMFFSSHLRHHRFTQNPPHDLENPMPIVLTLRGFLSFGFVNISGLVEALTQTVRAAVGLYPTGHLGWLPEWEEVCYPATLPQARAPAQRWAAFMLAGHAGIAALGLWQGCAVLPLLLSCGPFLNGWLFWLCNSTQHVGLQPGVADFRLNTRSFYLHPVLSFLYWRMNYHTEHHMWPRVPCYHLAELHQAIKHDLPPTPNGLVGVWTAIAGALKKQELDKGACTVELPAKRACSVELPDKKGD
jgi:fatty acid desaturase